MEKSAGVMIPIRVYTEQIEDQEPHNKIDEDELDEGKKHHDIGRQGSVRWVFA